ncbi:hypothetical protein BDV41DRAFT_531753 [Aspergillus transmontanensis]|uniref:Uncharacterized protein n=1 Tax=Aspergillus transmontanensis TaxID=1034304 RepID=A0A5N6W4A3_9EURO|nr:hypothetical protein BDV41DRAFT_531753 [Aspergillus transmontanensis]
MPEVHSLSYGQFHATPQRIRYRNWRLRPNGSHGAILLVLFLTSFGTEFSGAEEMRDIHRSSKYIEVSEPSV